MAIVCIMFFPPHHYHKTLNFKKKLRKFCHIQFQTCLCLLLRASEQIITEAAGLVINLHYIRVTWWQEFRHMYSVSLRLMLWQHTVLSKRPDSCHLESLLFWSFLFSKSLSWEIFSSEFVALFGHLDPSQITLNTRFSFKSQRTFFAIVYLD